MTRNILTPDEAAVFNASKELGLVLEELRGMSAKQLVVYAHEKHGTALPLGNGRQWLLKKVGYMETARIKGGLTGRAAENAAALDKPEIIAELKAEDEQAENNNLRKQAGRTKKPMEYDMKTALKTTVKAATGKGVAKAVKTDSAARGRYAPTDKITVLVEENPKREGTAAHARFALYTKHKTVASFIAAGGTTADVHHDTTHNFIKIN